MSNTTTASATGAPSCDADFYSDEYVLDPVSGYHEMLSAGPVVWLHKNNLHAICGFDALKASLRNPDVFISGKGVSINDEVNEFLIGSTLNSDAPEHAATRAITFAPLTPKGLVEVRERIEAKAAEIAGDVAKMGQLDGVRDIAHSLPLSVVTDLVGLGAHGEEKMLGWGAATFEMMGDPRDRRDEARKNMGELRAFLDDPGMLAALSPDGWANRATKLAMEAGFERDKAVSLMRDYIAPSLDTTISAISYGVMRFAQAPAQWDKLRADRSLLKNAIEEIVRLNTPIKTLSRYVAEEIEVGGAVLPEGTRVMMLFGAANRDPARFENPDEFDIERNTRGHMGFGHGVHQCLGMHLARLEMECLFNALLDRIERFELTGEPVPSPNSSIYSLAELPLRVHI